MHNLTPTVVCSADDLTMFGCILFCFFFRIWSEYHRSTGAHNRCSSPIQVIPHEDTCAERRRQITPATQYVKLTWPICISAFLLLLQHSAHSTVSARVSHKEWWKTTKKKENRTEVGSNIGTLLCARGFCPWVAQLVVLRNVAKQIGTTTTARNHIWSVKEAVSARKVASQPEQNHTRWRQLTRWRLAVRKHSYTCMGFLQFQAIARRYLQCNSRVQSFSGFLASIK